jgi:hypothetical protein
MSSLIAHNRAVTVHRLCTFGTTAARLRKTPVGLALGARTPFAVSDFSPPKEARLLAPPQFGAGVINGHKDKIIVFLILRVFYV